MLTVHVHFVKSCELVFIFVGSVRWVHNGPADEIAHVHVWHASIESKIMLMIMIIQCINVKNQVIALHGRIFLFKIFVVRRLNISFFVDLVGLWCSSILDSSRRCTLIVGLLFYMEKSTRALVSLMMVEGSVSLSTSSVSTNEKRRQTVRRKFVRALRTCELFKAASGHGLDFPARSGAKRGVAADSAWE